jgi:hypothetical protein
MQQQQVRIKVQEAVETFQEVEYNEWRDHPVTRQLFTYLKEKREELKELWATGGLAGPTLEEMAIKNAAAQGATSVLDDILSIDVDTFKEEGK